MAELGSRPTTPQLRREREIDEAGSRAGQVHGCFAVISSPPGFVGGVTARPIVPGGEPAPTEGHANKQTGNEIRSSSDFRVTHQPADKSSF